MRIDYPTALPESDGGVDVGSAGWDRSVVVAEVEQGTSAWEAGLRPGMLVSQVDRQPVRTPKEFRAAVAGKTGPVRLSVPQGPSDETIRVVPPGS